MIMRTTNSDADDVKHDYNIKNQNKNVGEAVNDDKDNGISHPNYYNDR